MLNAALLDLTRLLLSGRSEASSALPALGARPRAYTNRDIFSGFSQGSTGNCTSVGAIKAAMMRFGPDRVFSSVNRTANGHDITMRDGHRVHVSNQELQAAKQASRFKGNDSHLVDQANLMYAAMAKRAMHENNDGRARLSYQHALRSLNDGESMLEGPHWLGLGRHVRRISPSEM